MYTPFNDFNSKEVPFNLYVRLPIVEISYGNILAGFSLPVGRQGKTNLIVKGGFNDYGGSEGFGPLEGQDFKARGIPLLGGVRVYAEAYDSD